MVRPFAPAVVSNALNGNVGLVLTSFAEFYHTVAGGKDGEIFTHAYILTGMVNGTSLTDNYVTGYGRLSSEYLYTQPFALGVAAVLYAAFTFFVCHSMISV